MGFLKFEHKSDGLSYRYAESWMHRKQSDSWMGELYSAVTIISVLYAIWMFTT